MEEYGALVIDEGQDFRCEWLEALDLVVKDSAHGAFYVFYDDNQNVTCSSAAYIRSMPSPHFRLSRNFRNTREIFEQAKHYYCGPSIRCGGPDGTPIRWVKSAPGRPTGMVLSEALGSLIYTENIIPRDIAVIFPTIEELQASGCSERIGRWTVRNAETRNGSDKYNHRRLDPALQRARKPCRRPYG